MSEIIDPKDVESATIDAQHTSPPAPSTNVAATTRRAGHCTHQKLTRLYDRYGDGKCPSCHRYPAFGWLYRCTQDTDGMLPASDFTDTYKDQCDRMSINQPEISADQSLCAEDDISPVLTNGNLLEKSSIVVECPAIDGFNAVRSKSCQSYFAESGPLNHGSHTSPQLSHSACGMKVCVTCRPIYRDRSWQSLNSIVHEPLKSPSEYELQNKPTSDRHLLANMNYRSKRFYARLPTHSIGERVNLSVSSCRQEGDYQIREVKVIHPNESDSSIPFPKMTEEPGSDLDVEKRGHITSRLRSGRLCLQQLTLSRPSASTDTSSTTTTVSNTTSTIYGVESLQKTVQPLKDIPSSASDLLNHNQSQKKKVLWELDVESKEKRMGRRLSSGRFFID